MRYAFRVLYFGYPLVSPIVVSIFICHSVAGVSYLEADFRVICGTATWWWAVAWSIVWTAGYVIGFPVLVVWGIRRGTVAKLQIPEFDNFKDDARYWEVVDFLKKLFLTTGLLVFPGGTSTRILLAVVFTGIILVVFVWHKPYRQAVHNRLETVTSSALLLTYFIGLLASLQPSTTQHTTFGALLLSFMLIVVWAALFALLALQRATRRSRRQEDSLRDLSINGGGDTNVGVPDEHESGADGDDNNEVDSNLKGYGADSVELSNMAATGVVQNPAYCEAQQEAEDGPAHVVGSTTSADRTARTDNSDNDNNEERVAGNDPLAQDVSAGKAKSGKGKIRGDSTANPLGLDQETLDVLAAASASAPAPSAHAAAMREH